MNNPREKSIGAQMAIVLQLMKRKNHQAIADAGYKITMEQLAVLEILNFYGDMNMTELSHAVWKQNANITRIVDKLEKRKLVVRKAVEGDRRAYLLSITNNGKQLFNDVIPIILKNYKDMTSCITKEEEATTIKTMINIIKHLSQS
ncbi:MAG: MarR family transcriptional regulator [Bacteroidales bacterium]|nr:MarR family transcriptional regulator [Bacteroidales bacterium]